MCHHQNSQPWNQNRCRWQWYTSIILKIINEKSQYELEFIKWHDKYIWWKYSPHYTSSSHYTIPITKAKRLINNLNRESDMSITLTMTNDKHNHNITLKLHRQFTYPSQEKLLQLIKNAGEPWCGNQNLVQEIKNVSNNCPTCKKYKKVPPRPVVGLPMATEFLETVAMDLKFYDSKILLHLVDHCMRLSNYINIHL